jgi:fructokinase
MSQGVQGQAYAGVELGGTKLLCRVLAVEGGTLAEGRFATSSPAQAITDVSACVRRGLGARKLAALGIASFGPIRLDPNAKDYGRILATPKPGWRGFELAAALRAEFDAPLVVDTDVNAAAIAEQALGAGRGLDAVAYVTVGTGIGAGLALGGKSLQGALHPEVGHLRLRRRPGDTLASSCPFHEDCAEGLASGPAVARRLGGAHTLAADRAAFALVAAYLGDVCASLVLSWAPQRILVGGGVLATEGLLEAIASAMHAALAGYLPEFATAPGYLAPPQLTDAGLEGALHLARGALAGT